MNSHTIETISVLVLVGQPFNPNGRSDLESAKMAELAKSIEEHGLFYPVLVRAIKGKPGQYEIIDGHRRFAAMKYILKLERIPCIILESEASTKQVFVDVNAKRQNYEGVQSIQSYLADGPVPSPAHLKTIERIDAQHGVPMLEMMVEHGLGPRTYERAEAMASYYQKSLTYNLSVIDRLTLIEEVMNWIINPGTAKDIEECKKAKLDAGEMVKRIRAKRQMKLKLNSDAMFLDEYEAA